MEFPLHVFRNHIYAVKRRLREEPLSILKRNEKARKEHDREVKKMKKQWETIQHNDDIDELITQFNRM